MMNLEARGILKDNPFSLSALWPKKLPEKRFRNVHIFQSLFEIKEIKAMQF